MSLSQRDEDFLTKLQKLIDDFPEALARVSELSDQAERDYVQRGVRNAYADKVEQQQLMAAIDQTVATRKEFQRLLRAAERSSKQDAAEFEQQQKLKKQKEDAAFQANEQQMRREQQRPSATQRNDLLNLVRNALRGLMQFYDKQITKADQTLAILQKQSAQAHQRKNVAKQRLQPALQQLSAHLKQQMRQHPQAGANQGADADVAAQQDNPQIGQQPQPSAPSVPPPAYSPEAVDNDEAVDHVLEQFSQYAEDGQIEDADAFFHVPQPRPGSMPSADQDFEEEEKDDRQQSIYYRHDDSLEEKNAPPVISYEDSSEFDEEHDEDEKPSPQDLYQFMKAYAKTLSFSQREALTHHILEAFSSGEHGAARVIDSVCELYRTNKLIQGIDKTKELVAGQRELLVQEKEYRNEQFFSLEKYDDITIAKIKENAGSMRERCPSVADLDPRSPYAALRFTRSAPPVGVPYEDEEEEHIRKFGFKKKKP